jgi:hypothetical protein
MRPDPETVTQPGHDGTGRPELISDGHQAVLLVDAAIGKEGHKIREPECSRAVLHQPPIWAEQGEIGLKDEPSWRSRR